LKNQEHDPFVKGKKIREVLKESSLCLRQAGLEHPLQEAETMLAYLMGIDRLQLFLNDDEPLPLEIADSCKQAVRRRSAGEPLAYIIGEKYFYGYRFAVNKNVLIPRPETELIVERAMHWTERMDRKKCDPIRAVDLGTGSGVLAVTLALVLNPESVWAIDCSENALKTATLNARLHNVEGQISFVQGNYFAALQKIKPLPLFNLVVANPPYVQSDQLSSLPDTVKNYEPVAALNGGEDGLDGYRAILSQLHQHVCRPALILFEIGADQKDAVEALCLESGLFDAVSWTYDLAGYPRVFEGEVGL
jgi:release factor glutamine methyltransferase